MYNRSLARPQPTAELFTTSPGLFVGRNSNFKPVGTATVSDARFVAPNTYRQKSNDYLLATLQMDLN